MARKAKSRKKSNSKKRKPSRPAKVRRSKAKRSKLEQKLDEGLAETFPGSDAIAVTDPVRTIREN